MVSEEDVGITQYANSLPGFVGILKHRYTDFKVNEVDSQGRVVRLTSLEAPQVLSWSSLVQRPVEEPLADSRQARSQTEATERKGGRDGEGGAAGGAADVDGALASFARLAGDAQLGQLREFLEQALAWQAQQGAPQGEAAARGSRPKAPSPLTLNPIASKETRKAVHQLFKSLQGFPPLETNTVAQPEAARQQQDGAAALLAGSAAQQGTGGEQGTPGNAGPADAAQHGGGVAGGGGEEPAAAPAAAGVQCIEVRLARGGGRGQKRKWQQAVGGWAGSGEEFVRFVLYKENMDSQVALSTLARLLHANHKVFGVAGTKDKRGVTVQAVTARHVDPARLAALNARLRGMRVGNFQPCSRGLWLGALRGNRFEVILRNIEAEDAAAVEAAAEGLRQSGFVNYFGLQRFGSGAVATHRVGRALLRGEWREAVRLLLTARGDAKPAVVAACRAYLGEEDIEGALKQMPRHMVAECAVLQGLKQYGPAHHLQALQLVPRNLRTMYLHAYQSFLWNAAASHRVSTHPRDRPVPGDLVLLGTGAAAAEEAGSGGAAGGDEAGGAAAGGAEAAAAGGEAGEEGAGVAEGGGGRQGAGVHVVTEEEAAAGAFSMEDVVLPLPGWQIRYPEHDTAQVYTEAAQRDGVSLTEAPHGTREFMLTELPGGYRRVLHRPADLQYEVVRYDDPDQELATTDLMLLEGRQPPPLKQDGRYLALRLAFQLPTSCYATMLIRELTKMDTSKAFQKTLQH